MVAVLTVLSLLRVESFRGMVLSGGAPISWWTADGALTRSRMERSEIRDGRLPHVLALSC